MKTLKWLEKNFELAILAVFLAMMCVISFANVIARYFFKSAFSWSDEICCYSLALSAFYTLPCAIRMRSYICVDTFVTLLPKAVKETLAQVTNVIMAAFLIFFLKGTLGIIVNAAKIGQTSPALGIPLSWLYSGMAFAIMLAIARCIQSIIWGFKKRRKRKEGGKS